jgi:DNA-directed RNA polymerase specialized sigma24 family protein
MRETKRTEDSSRPASTRLLRSYYETILQHCYARCRTRDDALECAQAVVVRLLPELKRGRRYCVPFRVVVTR